MRAAAIVCLLGVAFAQGIRPEEYRPEDYPGIEAWLSNLPEELHKEMEKKLKEAAGNWRKIADALLRTKKENLRYMAELIKSLEPLDLLETESDWLLEHLRYAMKARGEAPWKIDDETFIKHVLASHLYYTHFRPWRKFLYERFAETLRKGSVRETALAVNRYIAGNIKRQKKRTSFFGWLRNPVEVVASGRASLTAARGLCMALLRALCVPARRHQRGWIEFYDPKKKEWLPVYPFKPENFTKKEAAPAKRAYAKPGTLSIRFHKGKTPLADFAGFSINKKSTDGLFDIVWHPFFGGKTDKEGKITIKLPPGVYHLIAGVRNRNGDPYIYHKVFRIESGKKVELDVDLAIPLSEYREEDWVVRPLPEEAKKAKFRQAKGEVRMEDLLRAKSALVYLFNLDSEPCVSMLPLVCEFAQNVEKALLVFIGDKPDGRVAQELASLKSHPPLAWLKPEEARRLFKLPYSKRQKRFKTLPAVLLFKEGRLLLWSEGYDLNIKSVLEAAMKR